MARKVQASADRSALGFPKAVRTAFGFLESEFGFKCITSESTLVHYEAEHLFVNVYHGRQSYELQVAIGAANSEEPGYTLRELRQSSDPQTTVIERLAVALTAQQVEVQVPRLATAFIHYAAPILHGDLDVLARLQHDRREDGKRYAKETRLFHIRRQAERARLDKDWPRLISLYQPIYDDLSLVERKRLEYAERRLKKLCQAR